MRDERPDEGDDSRPTRRKPSPGNSSASSPLGEFDFIERIRRQELGRVGKPDDSSLIPHPSSLLLGIGDDAAVELFEEVAVPTRRRDADREEAEARARAHRRNVGERDGERLVSDVARGNLKAVEAEVYPFDEEVGGDDRVEACALAYDRGVVADAEEKG